MLRLLRRILYLALGVVAGLALLVVWLSLYALRPGPGGGEGLGQGDRPLETRVVQISRGSSMVEIARQLAAAGLVHEDRRFLLLAILSGRSGRLPAGEFLLDRGQRPLDLLAQLAVARPIQHQVTIPEGLTAAEIGAIFAAKGWCDRRSFANLVTDRRFIASLGYPELRSLEGYLYPDSYLFTRDNARAEKIIARLVGRFTTVWAELAAERAVEPSVGPEAEPAVDAAEPAVEVDREETVILASIVEKEAAVAAERPLIAGVFHNRLRLGMRLQSDPTAVYGLVDFSGPITRRHLQTPGPYNTYTRAGLPIGPICNPGRDSLRAVLFPAETDSLYFVAQNDGSHHFSASLAEHNRAVQKYQRKKSPKEGK